MDTQLTQANVTAQNAAKKPHIFAFGEYSLDDKNNWIVGLAASTICSQALIKTKMSKQQSYNATLLN